MVSLLTWFRSGPDDSGDEEQGQGQGHEERQPLLAQQQQQNGDDNNNNKTSLQRTLGEKLHTYQMLRALAQGYLPSTAQAIVLLRTLLAARICDPDQNGISDSGRALAHYMRQLITQLIECLRHKNGDDQLQDAIWFLSKAHVSLDVDHWVHRASQAKTKSDETAAYRSLQVVGSLLLANPNVRLLASDVVALGREVLSDTAMTLSDVARDTGERVKPGGEEQDGARETTHDVGHGEFAADDAREQVDSVTQLVVQGAGNVAQSAAESVATRLDADEKNALLDRLKQAVQSLRRREGYTDSVSTLLRLVQEYVSSHVHAAEEMAQGVRDDVHRNAETDRGVHSLYRLVRTLGSSQAWAQLEAAVHELVQQARSETKLDELVAGMGDVVHDMFVEPAFFDDPAQQLEALRVRCHQLVSATSLGAAMDKVCDKAHATLVSVGHDEHMSRLAATVGNMAKLVWPDTKPNADMASDLLHVYLPQLVGLVRYLPIPRVEIAAPQLDLLLENVILEPGQSVNNASFLPYTLRVESHHELEVRKGRFRVSSAARNRVRVTLQGISVRADEFGFWLRGRAGWLRLLADEGIASIALDERGMDMELDVEIGKDRIEHMVSLDAVRVHMHKLDWRIQSRRRGRRWRPWWWLAWLLQPMLRGLVRRSLEHQLASAVAAGLHVANRELVFARERLRATRVASPDSIVTFVRAVAARLVPAEDPDVQTRLGWADPEQGVFAGVFTPASLMPTWREEGVEASQRVRERAREKDGWRNAIFDVHATLLS